MLTSSMASGGLPLTRFDGVRDGLAKALLPPLPLGGIEGKKPTREEEINNQCVSTANHHAGDSSLCLAWPHHRSSSLLDSG